MRLTAILLAALLLLCGCNKAGDPTITFGTSENGAAGPVDNLASHVLITGLIDDSITVQSAGNLYEVYESGMLSLQNSGLEIAKQPGDTRCFLYRKYDDITEKYLECYDEAIKFNDRPIPVGRFTYTLSTLDEVMYSSEELLFYPDANGTNGYSHVATNDSGLFFKKVSSAETVGYFTDASSLDGSTDYCSIEQSLFEMLQNQPSVTSVETIYTHEITGVLLDVEYRISIANAQTPMAFIALMAQELKTQTEGTTIAHLPYGYIGTSSAVYVLGATIFPSSSASSVFYALRAATPETLGVGQHFPTSDIKREK